MTENKSVVIRSEQDLKMVLATSYMKQINNFFGEEQKALKFLSSAMATVQKTPELLNCTPVSLINSLMTMAQLGLMPSDVAGEAYILPYSGKAQFQLGYQGILTLFYRAGGQSVRAEVVRKNDKFSYINGVMNHEIDITKSNDERGEIVAVYAIAKVGDREISKAMNIADVMKYKEFSKAKDSKYSPWNSGLDPESWMLKKVVLKQLAKLLPKNETINKAIAEDNQESIVAKAEPLIENSNLKMGNLLVEGKDHDKKDKTKKPKDEEDTDQENGDVTSDADSDAGKIWPRKE
jgi:recombination protein RecT